MKTNGAIRLERWAIQAQNNHHARGNVGGPRQPSGCDVAILARSPFTLPWVNKRVCFARVGGDACCVRRSPSPCADTSSHHYAQKTTSRWRQILVGLQRRPLAPAPSSCSESPHLCFPVGKGAMSSRLGPHLHNRSVWWHGQASQ